VKENAQKTPSFIEPMKEWGVGLEGVDVEAATKAEVWVARVPLMLNRLTKS
jgi:hypothetical protein